jgi:hypothetical protein|tara:strand:- start:1019 stop:1216 length:198 start_codon:yes stop_codon:yes gene_type:complete
MISVKNVLRVVFGARKASHESLLIWAKTEYGKDWRFAYEHMLDNNGQPPQNATKHLPKANLKGWV